MEGEAEVEELEGAVVTAPHDVGGLKVGVHEGVLVQGADCSETNKTNPNKFVTS